MADGGPGGGAGQGGPAGVAEEAKDIIEIIPNPMKEINISKLISGITLYRFFLIMNDAIANSTVSI